MDGGPRSGEQGSAMLLVVSLLLALSLLSALWMAAAHADALVAIRKKGERESFYAAEAVLETALADLADLSRLPVSREALLSSPPSVDTKGRRGTFDGWEYRWRVTLLPDGEDMDGREDTPYVLFDRSFGYGTSPRAAGGFPVLQITASVCRGDVRRGIVAEAAPLSLSIQAPAAWTSAGGVALQGPFHLSGNNHDGAGRVEPDSSGALPALLAGGKTFLLDGAVGAGVVEDPGRSFATTPEEVLGLAEGESPRQALSALPPGPGGLSGLHIFTSDWSGLLRGEGAVVVHNPRFMPRPFEASRLALEEGIFTADYDTRYSHLDPRNQPAVLEVLGGGEFRGLVIADTVGAVHDTARIIGAVVTLLASPAVSRAYSRVEVLYSPEALREAELGPLTERLSLKALPWDSLTSDYRCD